MHTAPSELKKLYRQGRVVPFIGAGASMALEWSTPDGTRRGPSWKAMVDKACELLGYEDPELLRFRGTDLQILEYFEHKKGNFAPLTNWLVRELDAPDDAILSSSVHTALAGMANCRNYYTTNYDDFLERTLRLHGRKVQVVTSERDMGARGHDTEVVKFHGDFNSPDEMVFSEGHYYRRMRLDAPLDLKLRSDLLGRAAFFIGYSFRDLNVGYLFDVLENALKGMPNSPSGRRAYIVVHNPSDFEYALFHKRNMEVVPTHGDDRAAGLVEVLLDLLA